MSRHTPTRARVREVAELLTQKGIEPTSTLILARLGKGSPNTVVDELRRWKAERTGRPDAARSPQSESLQPIPTPAVHNDKAVNSAAEALSQLVLQLAPFSDTIKESAKVMGSAAGQLAEINAAVVRLDGIRLYALRQIDDARDKARYWEEEARRLKTDGADKEQVYRQAMYAARSEADSLRGQVEALKGVVATLQAPSGRVHGQVATLQEETRRRYEDPDGPAE